MLTIYILSPIKLKLRIFTQSLCVTSNVAVDLFMYRNMLHEILIVKFNFWNLSAQHTSQWTSSNTASAKEINRKLKDAFYGRNKNVSSICNEFKVKIFHVNNPKSPLPIALIIHIQLKKVCELQKAFSCNHCVKQNFNWMLFNLNERWK